jgi:AraC-like DNA-binding protein
MDALSDVLRVVKLTGGVFLNAEFTAPWCVLDRMMPNDFTKFVGHAEHVVLYHYIIKGAMRARVADGPVLDLGAGDAVMLPHHDYHYIGSDLSIKPTNSSKFVPAEGEGLRRIIHGGGGEQCEIVCGYLATDRIEGNPLFATLPSILPFYARESPGADWVRSTFQFAANEIASGRPGSDSVLAKLSELLFVEAVRRYVEALPSEQTGWLSGLRDTHISKALTLIHARIAERWTVEGLSREVGMSRSAFAERFASLIGESPMSYVSRWRMNVAAHTLRNSQVSVARIAESVGYESEAAFSRTFRQVIGVPPGAWRRSAQEKLATPTATPAALLRTAAAR